MTERIIEQWRSIPGYNRRYKVSNSGDVYSLYSNGRLLPEPLKLNPAKSKNGYLLVGLYDRTTKTSKPHSVHRLVAVAFLDNSEHLPMVNHKDSNKHNNSVRNLEWCTAQHNAEHARAKTYELIRPDGVLVSIFNLKKYCREHGINNSGLQGVHTGRLTAYKGWTKPIKG